MSSRYFQTREDSTPPGTSVHAGVSALSEARIRKFTLLWLASVLLTLPFALPAIWDVIKVWLELPRGIYLGKPVHNHTYHLEIAIVLGSVVISLARLAVPTVKLPRNSLVWLLAGLFVIQFAASMQSESIRAALNNLLLPAAFTAGFLFLLTTRVTVTDIEKIAVIALAAGVVAALYAILQSRGIEFLPYSRFMDEESRTEVTGKQVVASTFGHPNYMASYLAPLVFWALYFFLRAQGKPGKAMWAVAFIVLVVGLLVGGTRGPWLAVIIGAVPFYLLLTFSHLYRRQLVFFGVLAVVLALSVLFVPNPFITIQFDVGKRLLASKEITSRFYTWLIALEMFKDHPLMGVGYGNFNLRFWEYVHQFQFEPDSRYYRFILVETVRGINPGYVHNDTLQIMAETGTVGVLVWFSIWSAVVGQTVEAAVSVRRNNHQLLMTATFLASLATMGIDGIFSFPVHIPVSGFLFYVLLGSWCCFQATTRSAQREIKT